MSFCLLVLCYKFPQYNASSQDGLLLFVCWCYAIGSSCCLSSVFLGSVFFWLHLIVVNLLAMETECSKFMTFAIMFVIIIRAFFSAKRIARAHTSGKDKHTESFLLKYHYTRLLCTNKYFKAVSKLRNMFIYFYFCCFGNSFDQIVFGVFLLKKSPDYNDLSVCFSFVNSSNVCPFLPS